MKKISFFLLTGTLAALQCPAQDRPAAAFVMPESLSAGTDYLAKTVIVKLKPEYRYIHPAQLMPGIAERLELTGIARKFPHHVSPPAHKRSATGQPVVDLSLMYELRYNADVPLDEAINLIAATGLVEYAEPHWIPQLHYNPNDSFANDAGQYWLGKIRAYEAWDITRGDTSMVIGIVDTGTDVNGIDLSGWDKIKRNWAEDNNNGIDDDGDGYIDNFRGWDLGMNDNRPQAQGSSHGCHVTGCATAKTDNGFGIAAPGFNCTYLPVKVDSFAVLIRAYEGIVYAADHGAKVINCSWGRNTGGFSQAQQDIVNYATFNHDALVLSSAGNANSSAPDYPASYSNVLAVAGTDKNDVRYSSSSYGAWVDISAPSSAIRSVITQDTFAVWSGTSMGSGIAAGCAALLRTRFPSFNALQTGEQLKATADNIDAVNTAFYQGKLGTGRINLYRAVTETPPMISMINLAASDNNNGLFTDGDTVEITGLITNFLSPTMNLGVTFSSAATEFYFIDSTVTVGVLNSLDTTDNFSNPIRIVVKPGAPTASRSIIITFTDSAYSASQVYNIQLTNTSSARTTGDWLTGFRTYPNPARDFITVEFTLRKEGMLSLDLFDITGRRAAEVSRSGFGTGRHEVRVNTAHLLPGVYLFRITSANGRTVFPVYIAGE